MELPTVERSADNLFPLELSSYFSFLLTGLSMARRKGKEKSGTEKRQEAQD